MINLLFLNALIDLQQPLLLLQLPTMMLSLLACKNQQSELRTRT